MRLVMAHKEYFCPPIKPRAPKKKVEKQNPLNNN
jgi:hypothetical protein